MYNQTIPVNPFAQQSWPIWCELPKEAAVVDQVRSLNQLETAAKNQYQADEGPTNLMLNTLADIFDEARRNHPCRLVGIGENLMDLEPFDPVVYVHGLLGRPVS